MSKSEGCGPAVVIAFSIRSFASSSCRPFRDSRPARFLIAGTKCSVCFQKFAIERLGLEIFFLPFSQFRHDHQKWGVASVLLQCRDDNLGQTVYLGWGDPRLIQEHFATCGDVRCRRRLANLFREFEGFAEPLLPAEKIDQDQAPLRILLDVLPIERFGLVLCGSGRRRAVVSSGRDPMASSWVVAASMRANRSAEPAGALSTNFASVASTSSILPARNWTSARSCAACGSLGAISSRRSIHCWASPDSLRPEGPARRPPRTVADYLARPAGPTSDGGPSASRLTPGKAAPSGSGLRQQRCSGLQLAFRKSPSPRAAWQLVDEWLGSGPSSGGC